MIADAKNVDISSWSKNVSESALGTEPGNLDRYAEIAVSGSTVHVVWVADDAAVWDKHYVYYTRSTDGGATWEAKKEIYSAMGGGDFWNVSNRRLAVDGQNVHIFQLERRTSDSCSGIFSYVVITHFRSTDGGATFEARKDAVTGGCGRGLYATIPSASAGKVTLGYIDYHDWAGSTDHFVKVAVSEDNGATFASRTAFSAEAAPISGSLSLIDAKVLGDKIYAVFTLSHGYPGSGYGYSTDAYFAASSDRGATFTSNLISVPSNVLDSNGVAVHKTPYLQDYNHVLKIGAVGNNVYVTWTGEDSEGVMSAFFRRSSNSGVTFENAVNLSKAELPSGRIARWASETIAAQGNHVYVVFVAVDGSNGIGNARVYIKSSSDSGATFSAMQELSPAGDPNVGGGWWPMVQTDPSVASGAKVHVLWNWATYDSSSDGGASFAGPILVAPAPFTQGDGARPQWTVGSDGTVHFVVERNIYSSFTWGDMDIFYRRLAPPPAPVATDSALSLSADGYVQRYDTMQVPASVDTNFTSAMTAEAWIKPNRDADSSGYFIQKADPAISYTTTTSQTGSGATLNFVLGWNLAGNSSSGAIDVLANLGDGAKVTTVWKWIANSAKWAFYTPSLVGQALTDYLTAKGYEALTTINGGEGFWVNAKAPFTASLPAGTAISSSSFRSMGLGWNLIATGDNMSAREFNSALSATPPSDIPINVTTLWAWDATLANWYFYAPSMDKSGELAGYITSKSYLDFGAKLLDPTTEFWVNKP